MGLIWAPTLLLWGISMGHVLLLVLGQDPLLGDHPWGPHVGLRGAKQWDLRGTLLC